jgi:hypothetical protein
MDDQYFISRRGMPTSNRSRWLRDERWTVTRLAFSHGADQRTVAPLPQLIGELLVRATVVQIRRDWSLWHRNNEVRTFLLTLCVGS